METKTTFNNFLGGKITHASSFTGIGGFDYAASQVGWENIFQIEIDKFCNKVLELRFPNTKKFTDIKTFDGTPYKNKIDVFTGGFPCQPFSVAGKRKGNEDERALWYEMYRVIQQLEPTYVVAENVPGLLTIESGMVFEQVCLDLENAGYEVQPFIIPAASLNAPHKRDRIWIVAHANKFRERARFREVSGTDEEISERNKDAEFINSNNFYDKNTEQVRWRSEIGEEEPNIGEQRKFSSGNDAGVSNENDSNTTSKRGKRREQREQREQTQFKERIPGCDDSGNDTNTDHTTTSRQRRNSREILSDTEPKGFDRSSWERNWYEIATEFCRVDDGVSNRVDRLKSLGNAIVPQIAMQLFKAIDCDLRKERQKLLKVETESVL